MNPEKDNMSYIGDQDTETHRVCGACEKLLPVSEFYKDGKDSHGNTRYRRDCKNCYKKIRVAEARMKGKRGVK